MKNLKIATYIFKCKNLKHNYYPTITIISKNKTIF